MLRWNRLPLGVRSPSACPYLPCLGAALLRPGAGGRPRSEWRRLRLAGPAGFKEFMV
jgi:hypothetical protein